MRSQFLVLVILVASPYVWAAEAMFPLPLGARDFKHLVLQPDVAEQDFFSLRTQYPSTIALEHYNRVLATWRQCPGREKDWISYSDESRNTSQFVHIRSHFFATRKNDRAIAIILRYESNGAGRRAMPDDDHQFVTVVRYSVPDAAAFLSELGAVCGRSLTRHSSGRPPAAAEFRR